MLCPYHSIECIIGHPYLHVLNNFRQGISRAFSCHISLVSSTMIIMKIIFVDTEKKKTISMLFWALFFFPYCLLSHSWVISKYFNNAKGRKASIRTHLWKFQGCPLISWPNHLPAFRFLAPQWILGGHVTVPKKECPSVCVHVCVYTHIYIYMFIGNLEWDASLTQEHTRSCLGKRGKKLPTLSSGVSNLAVDTLKPFMLLC